MASGLGLASLDPHTHFDLGGFTGGLGLIAVFCACCNVYAARVPKLKPVLEKLLATALKPRPKMTDRWLPGANVPARAHGFSALPFGTAPTAASLVMPGLQLLAYPQHPGAVSSIGELPRAYWAVQADSAKDRPGLAMPATSVVCCAEAELSAQL